ncbi:MAG: hypothetical protein DRO00_09755, partial [Thermoproteota archaeon]
MQEEINQLKLCLCLKTELEPSLNVSFPSVLHVPPVNILFEQSIKTTHNWEEVILDLFDAINERRSVRWFKQDPLDKSIIRKILEAAIRAPTAMAMEQWFFIVVKDEGMCKKIWELLKKSHIYYYTKAREGSDSIDLRVLKKLQERLDQGMYRAPIYVAAFLKLSNKGLKKDYSDIEELWGVESVSAALENISLAATALGLGTCWIG